MLHRVLQISFFEWCLLWLVTVVSFVSVFLLTSVGTSQKLLPNPKLPEWIPPSKQHSKHGLLKTSSQKSTEVSKCNRYSLVTYNNVSFQEGLARLTSKDKLIVLCYVDMGFLDMAENFIETSLIKHGIRNVLFFSSSEKACQFLEDKLCISCYVAQPNEESEKQSTFGSLEFISKMNIRTSVIHTALVEGYDVIHTDTDVIFLHNPVEDLRSRCGGDCDVAPLWDNQSHNAGFLFIRSTINSKSLYKRMIEVAETFPSIDDQQIFNGVIAEMTEIKHQLTIPKPEFQQQFEEFVDPDKLESMDNLLLNSDFPPEPKELEQDNQLKVISLPLEVYLSGHEYFLNGHRNFAGDNACSKCIVMHNNWLVKKSSKIWRFKENHLWVVNTGKYYTNPNARFISVENLVETAKDDVLVGLEDLGDEEEFEERQKVVLENGFKLAKVLNRTLILPKMFINKFSPPMPAWYVHEKFLNKLLHDYHIEVRESTFLSHPKVPKKYQSQASVPIKITMDDLTEQEKKLIKEKKLVQFKPRNQLLGPTKKEVFRWFGTGDFNRTSVLRFTAIWNELKFLTV